MIETNIQNFSVEEIMEKIKEEVKKRKQINIKKENTIYPPISVISKIYIPFVIKEIYEYSDFTQYHDIDFIKNLYRGILRREVDNTGLNYYLNQLRSGKKSKSEIISAIRYSKEGRKVGVKLLGSKKRALFLYLYSLPILGYCFKWIVTIAKLPILNKRLNELESYIYQLHKISIDNDFLLEKSINTKISIMNLKADKSELESKADKSELESKADKSELESKADKSELESKADKSELESKADKSELESKADKSELENKVTYKEFDLYLQTISYAKEYMKISQKNMQNLIAEAQKRLPDEVLTDKDLKKLLEEEKHKYDNFYVEFEDRFRGSREDIKERLKVYLPYIKKLPFEIEGFSSLDVGCGRGEFLELLKENSYEKVKGIDINRVMVAKSKELGLNVEEVDVIEYLSNLQDESLSVITGFHIIEHLSFEVLMKLFEESYRVLKKGGMVIFETPNPENLVVGACNFYIDPTHRNPLPPQMIEFIVQNNNFTTEIKKLNGNFGINYEDSFLNHQFASQLDYAVIGYKK